MIKIAEPKSYNNSIIVRFTDPNESDYIINVVDDNIIWKFARSAGAMETLRIIRNGDLVAEFPAHLVAGVYSAQEDFTMSFRAKVYG